MENTIQSNKSNSRKPVVGQRFQPDQNVKAPTSRERAAAIMAQNIEANKIPD